MWADLGSMVLKFGGDPVIFQRGVVISIKSPECPIFCDLYLAIDLDFKHNLDEDVPGDHGLNVW